MKIVLAGWKLTRDETETIKKIADYITTKITDSTVITTDVYRHNITDAHYYFAFGRAEGEIKDCFIFPAIKDIEKDKQKVFNNLNISIDEIIKDRSEASKQKIYIETKEKVTIGNEACDVIITQEEAQYLKTLKSMLDGSKIVITKGDIRIEVE